MLRSRLALLVLFLLLTSCDAASLMLPHWVMAPCASPAPLHGKRDPRAPGYIVVYRPGTPARATTLELAVRYSFRPRYIYEHALLGFAAELPEPTVAALRCERVVRYVSHDARVKVGD